MNNALVLLRCCAAASAAMVLARMPVVTIQRMLASRSDSAADPRRAAEVARWLTPAYSLLRRRPSCFEKAVALSLALRWSGIGSRLVLGANTADGSFHAHAWVSAAGQEFFRDANREYEPVAAF